MLEQCHDIYFHENGNEDLNLYIERPETGPIMCRIYYFLYYNIHLFPSYLLILVFFILCIFISVLLIYYCIFSIDCQSIMYTEESFPIHVESNEKNSGTLAPGGPWSA